MNRILVVEDSPTQAQQLLHLLEQAGYDTQSAPDGVAALELTRTRRFDLVLTDVVMPGLNGRALAERLGDIVPGMRILFMSGYSDEAVHRHGVLGESAAFLEKPFTERALARKVREVLDA